MQRISRSRALSYVRWAKSRGFEAGYRAGLSKAESDLLRVIDQLRTTYNTAADIAHRDLEQLHFRLAEHLIDTASLGEPRTLACWIERAISVLKRNRPLRLLFNPRYEKIIEHISPQLPSTLHVAPSLDLKKVDFRLESDIGGVEFSWQAALEARRNEQPEPSDT